MQILIVATYLHVMKNLHKSNHYSHSCIQNNIRRPRHQPVFMKHQTTAICLVSVIVLKFVFRDTFTNCKHTIIFPHSEFCRITSCVGSTESGTTPVRPFACSSLDTIHLWFEFSATWSHVSVVPYTSVGNACIEIPLNALIPATSSKKVAYRGVCARTTWSYGSTAVIYLLMSLIWSTVFVISSPKFHTNAKWWLNRATNSR